MTAANPSWRRLGYLLRLHRLHALSVGAVAKALSRDPPSASTKSLGA